MGSVVGVLLPAPSGCRQQEALSTGYPAGVWPHTRPITWLLGAHSDRGSAEGGFEPDGQGLFPFRELRFLVEKASAFEQGTLAKCAEPCSGG